MDGDTEGAAVRKTIRKHYQKLTSAVTIGNIPAKLYEEELIGDDEMEVFTLAGKTDRDKGHLLLKTVKKNVQVNSDAFATLCKILRDENENTKQLSMSLQDMYEKHKLQLRKEKDTAAKPELERLREDLVVYKRTPPLVKTPKLVDELIKNALQAYIETTLEGEIAGEALKVQMQALCLEELLISTSLYDWTLKAVDEAIKHKKEAAAFARLVPIQATEQPPCPSLFSKDILYHCSLCCHAASVCSASSFSDFLRNAGHGLQQASLSTVGDNIDQYLMATRGDIIYVAFRSEATIKCWLKKYSSFDEGLEQQINRLPLRFFVEQILNKKQIVLTGFSFGGMLASCVAASLWKKSYISANVLEKNLVCITFGQPLISLQLLDEAIASFPQLVDIMHMVYQKDDLAPGLLHYFRAGCDQHPLATAQVHNGSAAKQLKTSIVIQGEAVLKPAVEGPFASQFLQSMGVLQEAASKKPSYSAALSSRVTQEEELKALETITTILHDVTRLPIPQIFGSCYIITSEPRGGLLWNAYSNDSAARELLLNETAIKQLNSSAFKKHNMEDYRQNMFRTYLEKDPDRFLPPASEPSKTIPQLDILQPLVEEVEFHNYPSEVIIVVQGNNLWFSHMVTITRRSSTQPLIIELPAKSASRRSIQFKLQPDIREDIITENGVVVMKHHSHFVWPQEESVTPKQEPYSFSLRQIQLAKHTPSEVIELAYCTAILERQSQLPKETKLPMSRRYVAVIQFLEEAAKVVPLESILHAIAYGNDSTSIQCCKALHEANTKLPISMTTTLGSMDAAIRFMTGIPLGELDASEITRLRSAFVFQQKAMMGMQSEDQSLRFPTLDDIDIFQTPKPSYSEVTRRSTEELEGDMDMQSLQLALMLLLPFAFLEPPLPYDPIDEKLAAFLENIYHQCVEKIQQGGPESISVVSSKTIEQFYPITHRRQSTGILPLQSPIDVLKDARQKLNAFIEESQEEFDSMDTQSANEEMLMLIKDIHDNKLKLCTALLASFMEQQIRIPLVTSAMNTASKVYSSSSAPVAMGAWALFSLDHEDLQKMLRSTPGNSLVVEIEDYISDILEPRKKAHSDRRYAAKLHFVLQGIKQTVTCSTQYISYSLEHQLCRHPKFDKSIPVKELVKKWDSIFKGDALSLVAKTHRPVIARWLKWALLVHDLREVLASYTCVGVIGLLNSGKSQLVKSLFRVETLVGTTKTKKTTVPFLYNLDGKIEGLDVIDFPGVDDKDSVPDLAKLLVGMAQVIVFVVDYRKIHSEPAVEWLEQLAKEDIPVLVCLTYADRLYVELCKKAESSSHSAELPAMSQKSHSSAIHQQMNAELEHIKEALRPYGNPSRILKFCCFHIAPDSNLTAENMKEVGISSPYDVGYWLVETFQSKLNQKELAGRLKAFL